MREDGTSAALPRRGRSLRPNASLIDGRPGHRQTPPWQVLGETQVVPQRPQLMLLVWRLTQFPAQSVKGAAQTHTPPLQVRLPPHAAPQKPQLVLLVARLAQVAPRPAPHWVDGGTHEMTHAPSEHRGSPAGQALPQAPQFALFDARKTQFPAPRPRPAHCTSPAGQSQVPDWHPAPPGHTVPHAPQLALLLERSTQAPPRPPPPMQSVRPPLPQPATQAPAEQVVAPRQPLPQPPQLALSFWGFTQLIPQRRSPGAHAQAPLTQLAPRGHCLLQAPQLRGSVCVSTQALPQVVFGAVQLALQVPPLQKGVAAGHTLPQAPQLFGSLWVWKQMLLQRVPPLTHWQDPFWQVVPAAQAVLQVPQFELFDVKSMHPLPHTFVPAGQVQAPPMQLCPAPHRIPHPPQLFGSV